MTLTDFNVLCDSCFLANTWRLLQSCFFLFFPCCRLSELSPAACQIFSEAGMGQCRNGLLGELDFSVFFQCSNSSAFFAIDCKSSLRYGARIPYLFLCRLVPGMCVQVCRNGVLDCIVPTPLVHTVILWPSHPCELMRFFSHNLIHEVDSV